MDTRPTLLAIYEENPSVDVEFRLPSTSNAELWFWRYPKETGKQTVELS